MVGTPLAHVARDSADGHRATPEIPDMAAPPDPNRWPPGAELERDADGDLKATRFTLPGGVIVVMVLAITIAFLAVVVF